MSAHVLLNLLNELGKIDKMRNKNHFCEKYIFHSCIPFGTPLTMVSLRENKR